MPQSVEKLKSAQKQVRRRKTPPATARKSLAVLHAEAIALDALAGVDSVMVGIDKSAEELREDQQRFVIAYQPAKGVDAYVRQVAAATPIQLVDIERAGVQGILLKDLSKRMEIPSSRIFAMLGVPKATAEKKAAAGEMVAGRGGQAALGMVRLLGIANRIVANSTAKEARSFDSAKWLGQWIERAQPSLGGRKPADLLDTPTGVDVVARLLGSIESGAYQ
jgi:putative toxin-antitoxin system antitoxin component (TIGR02293 family)